MYKFEIKVDMFEAAMARRGLTPYQLSKNAKVDEKTVRNLMAGRNCHPESIYKVAHALGLPVRDRGNHYDLSEILRTA